MAYCETKRHNFCKKIRDLSRERESSEQFVGLNH
jgi:hypothetical protein